MGVSVLGGYIIQQYSSKTKVIIHEREYQEVCFKVHKNTAISKIKLRIRVDFYHFLYLEQVLTVKKIEKSKKTDTAVKFSLQ